MILTNVLGINIITDIMCATLPIPIIWKLRMRLRTRVYLTIIFSLGYVYVVKVPTHAWTTTYSLIHVYIYRAVAMGVLKAIHQAVYISTPDQSFLYRVGFWGL